MQQTPTPVTNLEAATNLVGSTAIAYGLIQFLIKPRLRVKYGVEGNEQDDASKQVVWKYRREMNMWAIGLGVAIGVIFNLIIGYAGVAGDVNAVIALVAQGALTGFWGGGNAIGLHEAATNLNKAA